MSSSFTRSVFALFACLLLAAFAAPTPGQDRAPRNKGAGTAEDPYIVPKTESRIKVDAVLSEEAWEEALILELNYEVRPGENVMPPVRTEVLLIYDDKNLYAAFRCYDPDPSAIRAQLRDRDTLGGDDWIALIFDTFNDNRRSFDFIITSLGVQFDQIESPSGEDNGWDAIWDSSGQITDWGYAVEISIPFSSLRFQRKDGPQIWGFDAVRSYPRDYRYHIGTFPRDRSNNCYLCQSIKIKGFDGANPGRNIEINPTVTGVRTDERPEFPQGDLEKRDQEAEVGVTARWGMTPNLTLSLTANPDFSQVEADALQLDINEPFALFYQERRPFFTEGADFFNTRIRAVYTRTMRDPKWGMKLTGKEGANTIGAYIVRDDITNLIFPGSQGSDSTSLSIESTATVLRYSRDFGDNYTIGALFTGREGKDYFNRVIGFDGNLRFTDKDRVQIQFLGSNTRYPADISQDSNQESGRFGGTVVDVFYFHNTRNLDWYAGFRDMGKDFRADLGFVPMVDYRLYFAGWGHTWNGKPGSWWSMFNVGSGVETSNENDGDFLQRIYSFWFDYAGTMQSSMDINGYFSSDMYNGLRFEQKYFTVRGSFRPIASARASFYAAFGDRIDYANTRLGNRVQLNPAAILELGLHLNMTLDYTYERMTVNEAHLYTANIAQTSLVYQFSTRAFFRSIIQYVDYEYNVDNYISPVDPEFKSLFTQLLFSYKINARTVLFLGYSHNYFGEQEFGLKQADRTFFVKLGYAWEL